MKKPELNLQKCYELGSRVHRVRDGFGLMAMGALIATNALNHLEVLESSPKHGVILAVGIPISILVDNYLTGKEIIKNIESTNPNDSTQSKIK